MRLLRRRDRVVSTVQAVIKMISVINAVNDSPMCYVRRSHKRSLKCPLHLPLKQFPIHGLCQRAARLTLLLCAALCVRWIGNKCSYSLLSLSLNRVWNFAPFGRRRKAENAWAYFGTDGSLRLGVQDYEGENWRVHSNYFTACRLWNGRKRKKKWQVVFMLQNAVPDIVTASGVYRMRRWILIPSYIFIIRKGQQPYFIIPLEVPILLHNSKLLH